MGIKAAMRYALPHGIVEFYWERERKRQIELRRQRAAARQTNRSRAESQTIFAPPKPFTYDAALRFLNGLGIDPFHTRDGSMPLAALQFMSRHFERLDTARPIIGLHVGNFLGVSLAYVADALARLNPESRVVSLDPNIPHRGILRPTETTVALLSEFGLEDRVAILHGFSLEKNVSNDGEIFEGYDPVAQSSGERACTRQLALLNAVYPARFDLCLMDGNHDGGYLGRELDEVHRLLRVGGLLVLDDVSDAWPEIQAAFAAIGPDKFETLAANGRIGVLIKR
jgi:predicted O-methyltransferase YrrM